MNARCNFTAKPASAGDVFMAGKMFLPRLMPFQAALSHRYKAA
ncbi:hypothetical protein [Kingella oralis]|jgi:hypothetical protein